MISSLTLVSQAFVRAGRFVECVEDVGGFSLSDLEMAMDGVIEELTAFKEKCK